MIDALDRARDTVSARVRTVQTDILRATLVPNLVRLGVFVAGAVALLIADPATPWLPVFAILPAVFPRSLWATVMITVTSLLWLAGTSGHSDRLDTWRLCALAIALYGVHVGCALAAVLPYDAVYTRGVFRPWFVRAGIVSALTIVVGFVITALPQVISAGQPMLIATVGGIGLMVATAIFIAYLGFRRQ
jgi:hypothetical protein